MFTSTGNERIEFEDTVFSRMPNRSSSFSCPITKS